MSFKVLEDTEHAFKIQHPDGSHFMVAKSGLDDKVMKKIKGYADGGDVDGEDAPDAAITEPPPSQQGPLANFPMSASDVAPQNPTVDPTRAPSSQIPQNSAYQQGQLPYANVPPNENMSPLAGTPYDPIYKQREDALKTGVDAMTKYNSIASDALKQNQIDMAKATETSNINLKKIQDETTDSEQAYANGKINPNRLWNQTSAGNKVVAGIGMILGGIGAGLTHGPNQALQVVDKMIDRDIDSQRADQDRNKTIFGMNLQRYGNEQAAALATKNQLLTAFQSKLQVAQLGSNSAQAKQQYQLADATIKEQKLGLQLQLAKFGATRQLLTGTGPIGSQAQGQGGMPESQVPQALWTDPELSKTLVKVPSYGSQEARVYSAVNPEAGQQMRTLEPIAGSVVNLLHQLDKIGPAAALGHGPAAEEAESIRSQLQQKLPLLNIAQVGGKRGGESDAALGIVSNPAAFGDLLAKGVKTNNFFRNVVDDVERQRAQNLIGYKSNTMPAGKPGFK